jgi:hypothetical protein
MRGFGGALAHGAVAGAAGTTTLNAFTYLDMAVRGRPASSTPETTVEHVADGLGVQIPGDESSRAARLSGLGPLLGIAAGVGAGIALGAMRGAGWPISRAATMFTAWVLAMAAGNGPMTLLGITDPREWSLSAWMADVVPHAAYALTAAETLRALDDT